MPRENSIHQGLVVCTKEYGAFIQLGDFAIEDDPIFFHTPTNPMLIGSMGYIFIFYLHLDDDGW